jgi:hypothetical protein
MFCDDADHPHYTFAVDDLALVTDFLYRCPYFHTLLNSSMLTFPAGFARPGGRGVRRSMNYL